MTWHTTLDETDKYEICELYTEGSGIVELARQFRSRTAVINSVLAENGVTRKTKTASTPIECRLHDALRATGIGFSTQKRLADRYVVDIVLHQAPVIIEADGALHRWKPEARERDALRDVVHELAGYRVFRFTGSEINADAVACVQKVIGACGLVPDEDPVYDVRTKFSGPDHPRWADRFVEVNCEYCGQPFTGRADRNPRFCSPRHYNLHCHQTGALKGKKRSPEARASMAAAARARSKNQIMRESALRGDAQRPAETTGPATLF